MMNSEIFHRWFRSGCLACIAILFAIFIWVQWQGVRTARHQVVALTMLREEIVAVFVKQLLFAGFSVEEVYDYVYSVRDLPEEIKTISK